MDLSLILILVVPQLLGVAMVVQMVRAKPPRQAPQQALPDRSVLESASQRWTRASPWPALADAEGWQCMEDVPLGTLAGHRVTGRSAGPYGPVDFELQASLHAGLALGVVERIRIRARCRRPPQGLRLRGAELDWGHSQAQLHPHQPWLEGGGLTQALVWKAPWLELHLVEPALQGAELVKQSLALFDALRVAEFPFWYTPRPGWTLKLDSTGAWPRLSRRVDGRVLSASLEWVQGALRTRIMALLPPSDRPFLLVHASLGQGRGVKLKNPIADTLLHGSGDASALQAMLSLPGAFEAILAIVHGHPGSRLTHERVELIAPGDLGEGLPEAMEQVLAAAQAISGAPS